MTHTQHFNRTKKIVPLLSTVASDTLYMTGIKVHVDHFRRRKDYSPRQFFKLSDLRKQTINILEEVGPAAHHLVVTPMDQVDPKGGKTVVTLIDLNSDLQWSAEARCHEDDHYNRTEGINRAFEQASVLMREDMSKGLHTPVHAKPVDDRLLSPQEKDTIAAFRSTR